MNSKKVSVQVVQPDSGHHGLTLALRPKQAAMALGISERLLWSLTNRGEIPHVRLGKAVVYPVTQLREWLDNQSKPKTRK